MKYELPGESIVSGKEVSHSRNDNNNNNMVNGETTENYAGDTFDHH